MLPFLTEKAEICIRCSDSIISLKDVLVISKCLNIQQSPKSDTHIMIDLTSFISLLGTDLMIFPVKHRYIILVKHGPVTFCHCLGQCGFTTTKVRLIRHFSRVFDMFHLTGFSHIL